MTASIPRTRIRQWWAEQLATGQPIDLDEAAAQATEQLLADPEFVASLTEIVRPLVRDIGQKVAHQRTGARGKRVQLGSQVMSREQAMQLVDTELSERTPHWSRLVQQDNEPAWFMALDRDELMAEAKRRRESGEARLKESAFLWGVASTLESNQVVSDVWSEPELDAYFGVIKIEFRAKRATPALQLSGSAAPPSDSSSTETKEPFAA